MNVNMEEKKEGEKKEKYISLFRPLANGVVS
jgi:hypothetical protein